MTHSPKTLDTVEEIVAGLSEQDRSIARSLCGNAWAGLRPSPGILVMNGHGFLHIDARKSADGSWMGFKAHPTPLGLAVRQHLIAKDQQS